MGEFRPGERVPRSGMYRVYHDAHRLMHEAALLTDDAFPCCKQCGPAVRFEFIRRRRDNDILPFRSGEILQKWEDKTKAEEAS
ncbi:MAG TPA: hypothetical protein VH024_04400 [Candidatus Angelobacter sp.]|nr:hypothetical protein [Candidatus Angelobacter sp.]